jgi:hypothetical protein
LAHLIFNYALSVSFPTKKVLPFASSAPSWLLSTNRIVRL